MTTTMSCPPRPALRLVPVTLRHTTAFITAHHRHLPPPRGHRVSIGATSGGTLVGVVVVGRPLARHYDDGHTAQALRVCTDGTPNACSMLLAAAWRAARAMGYQRIITYTRADEPGTSLHAAGYVLLAHRPANPGWDRPSRPRTTHTQPIGRLLWQAPAPTTGGQP